VIRKPAPETIAVGRGGSGRQDHFAPGQLLGILIEPNRDYMSYHEDESFRWEEILIAPAFVTTLAQGGAAPVPRDHLISDRPVSYWVCVVKD